MPPENISQPRQPSIPPTSIDTITNTRLQSPEYHHRITVHRCHTHDNIFHASILIYTWRPLYAVSYSYYALSYAIDDATDITPLRATLLYMMLDIIGYAIHTIRQPTSCHTLLRYFSDIRALLPPAITLIITPEGDIRHSAIRYATHYCRIVTPT